MAIPNVDEHNVPFSISCYECDSESPPSYDEAVRAGWIDIQFTPDGLAENYLGLCPICAEEEDASGGTGGDVTLLAEGTRFAMAKTPEKNPPVHEVRLGRIKAVIWENQTPTGARHNVTVSRLYKDSDGWKDSNSFGRDDLPLVAKVVDQAHSWIFSHTSETANQDG